MPTSTRRLLGLRVVLLPMVVATAVGCASAPLPPRLTADQQAMARTGHIGGTVAVEPARYPVYSERLKAALIETGLFERVDSADHIEDPTLVATVERYGGGAAVIPLWTFLSLGLIPTIAIERHGLTFSLRHAIGDRPKVLVDASWSGRTTLGWAALFIGLSPRYAMTPPDESEQFKLYLRWILLSKARELGLAEPADPE